ncbi:MAG: hypothetical protein QF415_13875 [Candidatus Undinarchaeales archaeon]|jgi:hypothetical protein|nr:hypothetical protein [Candidatus Undinarchaeales archaeon]MDP7492066.1 hypothetical protein [Candidatus Undinarchaeales archaeon]
MTAIVKSTQTGSSRSSPLGTSRTLILLISLLVIQATLSLVILTPNGPAWGMGECNDLRQVRAFLARGLSGASGVLLAGELLSTLALVVPVSVVGPGALAAKSTALVLNAALLVLMAATLLRLGARREALVLSVLVAVTPALLRAPLLMMGISPILTCLFIFITLVISLPWERERSDIQTGVLLGFGLVYDRGFGALLIGLSVARFRYREASWWRPAVIAGATALLLVMVGGQGVDRLYDTLTTLAPVDPMVLVATLAALPTSIMCLCVAGAALVGLLRSPPGPRGELALAAAITGLLFLVVTTGEIRDSDITIEDISLAWVLLLPAATAGLEHLMTGRRYLAITITVIAILGAWDLLLIPAQTGHTLPICRESEDRIVQWDWTAPGTAGCPDQKGPWEDCVRRAGRDAVWEGGDLFTSESLSGPVMHIFALGVGEGLAELMGPGREDQVVGLCEHLDTDLSATCAAGVSSRAGAGAATIPDLTDTLCTKIDRELRVRCAYGLGAGILLEARHQGRPVGEGIELCSHLPGAMRSHCVRGFSQVLVLVRSKESSGDVPTWEHCEDLPERYVLQCMGGLGRFGWSREVTLEAAIETCVRTGDEGSIKACLINFGAAAGLHHSGEPSKAFELCEGLPRDLMGFCIEGIGDGLSWVLVTSH